MTLLEVALRAGQNPSMMKQLKTALPRWWWLTPVVFAAVRLAAAPVTIFQVTSFTNAEYLAGFVGTVGITTEWPAEMGRQGDRVDIGFNVPANPPPLARGYRFRVVVPSHFEQSFKLTVLAGPSPADLTEVHAEFINGARVVVANIPLERFAAGQSNWIRLQGAGVKVGDGQPAGIQWSRWALTRTDTSLDLDAAVDDQLRRAADYVLAAIQPSGLVRDSLTLSPSTPPFHPASPDAGGFALLALCAMDHLGLSSQAEARAQAVLSAYAGHTTGIAPRRNAKGHWWHWLNLTNGAPHPGWHDNYTTIGSALLVAGALFARNHFAENATIATHAEEMRATCDFDDMIHPSLDGRVALATDAAGQAVGNVQPWNEYMLIVSLALRQAGATRAPLVADRWLNPAVAPKTAYRGIPTLTDRAGTFAPAFWVQQQYFFNPDFAGNLAFVEYFQNHRRADALYCASTLRQNFRYGLTAGVDPSGYRADRIGDHDNVFSPSAVGGWGDVDTLLEFVQTQPPGSDPRTRYGLARVASTHTAWWPADAGLVDHLFLMFGLVEARRPGFFRERQSLEPAPKLALRRDAGVPTEVTVSWAPDSPGFVLQEATTLAPAAWSNSPSGETNPVTIQAPGPSRIFRLSRP